MIQRIQSVYLLAVTALLIVAMCLPIGSFHTPDLVNAYSFMPLGVNLADGQMQSTWGLFGILLLSTIISLSTIFLYRNRMLQVRMTIFNSILLVGYYLACLAFILVIKGQAQTMTFRIGWALCLPAIGIVLNYLAFRAIYADEVMVRAADRLR